LPVSNDFGGEINHRKLFLCGNSFLYFALSFSIGTDDNKLPEFANAGE